MHLETLYPLVTEAIRRAEQLDEVGDPGARQAYLDVSMLEELIASVLPQSDVEGAIARRGAVTAAKAAHEFRRAEDLEARFSAEGRAGDSIRPVALGEEALARPQAGRSDMRFEDLSQDKQEEIKQRLIRQIQGMSPEELTIVNRTETTLALYIGQAIEKIAFLAGYTVAIPFAWARMTAGGFRAGFDKSSKHGQT